MNPSPKLGFGIVSSGWQHKFWSLEAQNSTNEAQIFDSIFEPTGLNYCLGNSSLNTIETLSEVTYLNSATWAFWLIGAFTKLSKSLSMGADFDVAEMLSIDWKCITKIEWHPGGICCLEAIWRLKRANKERVTSIFARQKSGQTWCLREKKRMNEKITRWKNRTNERSMDGRNKEWKKERNDGRKSRWDGGRKRGRQTEEGKWGRKKGRKWAMKKTK